MLTEKAIRDLLADEVENWITAPGTPVYYTDLFGRYIESIRLGKRIPFFFQIRETLARILQDNGYRPNSEEALNISDSIMDPPDTFRGI